MMGKEMTSTMHQNEKHASKNTGRRIRNHLGKRRKTHNTTGKTSIQAKLSQGIKEEITATATIRPNQA